MLLIIDPALKINHTSASSYLFPFFLFCQRFFVVFFLGGGLSHVFLRTCSNACDVTHIDDVTIMRGPTVNLFSYYLYS